MKALTILKLIKEIIFLSGFLVLLMPFLMKGAHSLNNHNTILQFRFVKEKENMKKSCKRVLAASMSMALVLTSVVPAFAKTVDGSISQREEKMLNFQ